MDYDFITTCNWTTTGTFTFGAYRGSSTNIASSVTLYYRKKGTPTWSSTNDGTISITSIGEWEVANDWEKDGNNVLTHSYYGITAINSCTNVYFNESTLGTTVGDFFLCQLFSFCSNLTSMPEGFNLPQNITAVGNNFLNQCWNGCSSLTSMPEGFNLPQGITSVGGNFLSSCWNSCSNLTSMPVGFNIPSGIVGNVGYNFLSYCWNSCSNLTSMPAGFNLPQGITTAGGSFLTRCWSNCSKLVSMPAGFNLPQSMVGNPGQNFLQHTWYQCYSLTSMPSGFNIPQGITIAEARFLNYCWGQCSELTHMPEGFNIPQGITGEVQRDFFSYTWYFCSKLVSMPRGFSIPPGITSVGIYFFYNTWAWCSNLKQDDYTEDLVFEFDASNVFGGTCPVRPQSVEGASKENPASVAVNRPEPSGLPGDSERDLYLEGKPAPLKGDSERVLYLLGLDQAFREVGLYTGGSKWEASERGIYTKGLEFGSSIRGVYLSGKTFSETERALWVGSYDSGTGERLLYVWGCVSDWGAKGLFLSGLGVESTERGLFIGGEGIITGVYSRENTDQTKSDNEDLGTVFTNQDYTNVAEEDDAYVDLEGSKQNFYFLFKEQNLDYKKNTMYITWKGRTNYPVGSIRLLIYNLVSEEWEVLEEETNFGANEKVDLLATVSENLEDYYDENYIVSCMVVQDIKDLI